MANTQNLKPWKPGQSGNPAGRPVGTVSLSFRIQRMMTDEQFTAQTVGRRGHTGQYIGEPADAIIRTPIRDHSEKSFIDPNVVAIDRTSWNLIKAELISMADIVARYQQATSAVSLSGRS